MLSKILRKQTTLLFRLSSNPVNSLVAFNQRGFALKFNQPSTQAQNPIDEDKVPESQREDRSTLITEDKSLRQEKGVQEILDLNSIGSIENYYNAHKKHLNVMQNALVLYKLDEQFKSMNKTTKDEKNSITRAAQSDQIGIQRTIADQVAKQIGLQFNKQVEDFEKRSIILALNSLASLGFGNIDLAKETIEELERKILNEFPKYTSLDVASLIHSFFKLNYFPREIIAELNQMQVLGNFNKYSCIKILESMIASKFNENPEFYDKLMDQLQKNSVGLNGKTVNKIFQILITFKELQKDKDLSPRIQFFIDRFNDLIKNPESHTENEVLFSSFALIKQLIALHPDSSIDIELYQTYFLKQLVSRLDKMKPDTYFNSYEMFVDNSFKQDYTKTLLDAMRKNEFDVRKFSFTQLSNFILQLSNMSAQDMKAFYKYINSCLDQQFYTQKDLSHAFNSFTDLFYLFTKEGYISFDAQSLFYYNYIITLKENMKGLSYGQIIRIVWCLMVNNDESQPNPMIPHLFQQLNNLDVKTITLSSEDKLHLQQINIYAQDQVKLKNWPKNFSNILKEKLKDQCEQEFSQFDKCLYPEVQKDIAQKLLRLRCTFQENQRISKGYRVDLKLLDVNKVVILKGKNEINQLTNNWYGTYALKWKYFMGKDTDYEVVMIDVDKWNQKPHNEQIRHLFQMSRTNAGEVTEGIEVMF